MPERLSAHAAAKPLHPAAISHAEISNSPIVFVSYPVSTWWRS
jgi:hypothetical protein